MGAARANAVLVLFFLAVISVVMAVGRITSHTTGGGWLLGLAAVLLFLAWYSGRYDRNA